MNIEFLNHNSKELFIQITNNTGLEVVLCNIGASIYSIKLDGEDMLLSYKDLSFFTSKESKQGRFRGRIARDEYIDGNDKLLSNLKWNYEVSQHPQGIIITFYIKTKPIKNEGLGKCIYKVHYKIPKVDNNVIVEYEAFSKKECYFQLTNSLYFNIGLQDNVLSQSLQLSASYYLDGSGHKVATKGSELDLTESKLLNELKPLHHHFYYQNIDYSIPMAILKGELYKVEIYSDFDDLYVSNQYKTTNKILTDDSNDVINKGILVEVSNYESEYKAKKQVYLHRVKFAIKRNFE